MALPENRHNMLRAGYVLLSTEKFSVCKGCGAFIEWWKTTNGKHMPFDPGDERELAVCHWATCPKSKEFKGKASKPVAKPNSKADLPAELSRLLETFHARVVVLVDDQGIAYRWRPGVPAEELRGDLIAAGNAVRNRVLEGASTNG